MRTIENLTGIDALSEDEFDSQHLEAILDAIAATSTKLKYLQLKGVPQSFFANAIVGLPSAHAVFAQLKDLKIEVIDSSGSYDFSFLNHFRNMIRSCHNLENLCVLMNLVQHLSFDIIAPESAWTKLRSLKLCNISFKEDDLVKFSIHHQPQLTWVILSACMPVAGKWSSIQQRLQPVFAEQDMVEYSDKEFGAVFASFASTPHPDFKNSSQSV